MNKWIYLSNCLIIAVDTLIMIKHFQMGEYAWACIFAGVIGMLIGATLARAADDWRHHD